MSLLDEAIERLERVEPRAIVGRVAAVRGLSIEVHDLPLPVGAIVRVDRGAGRPSGRGEVVGFRGPLSIVMPLDDLDGIAPGMRAEGEQAAGTLPCGSAFIGRVVDAFGAPIDDGGPIQTQTSRLLQPPPISPLRRERILRPLPTGVRAIDGMLTLGRGQRIGLFAGPGVGKSTLLASIARSTEADVNVIALVGERGREVPDFLHKALGDRGLARSVVVVATGDESPLRRVRAAFAATTLAEHFRDEGADVLLMMDSLTRLAQAQRQVGLTAGEQPATRGYPPSVFAMMPRLLERAGPMVGSGSITGLYTVLVEGDDLTEPVSDTAQGVLDGHVVLSRRLASRGHYPAIDVLESVSRVADDVSDEPHREARGHVRALLAAYAEQEELIQIGAYVPGRGNELCDRAIERRPAIEAFLRQPATEGSPYPVTCRDLLALAAGR